MGKVRTFFETESKKSSLKPQELLASLRQFHHSIHEEERHEVIAMLSELADADASRELIQLFDDCQWRETKIKIIQALSKHKNTRAIEFLILHASNEEDLPVAEAAILALGKTGEPMAARYLARKYESCGKPLKPVVAGALGTVGERSMTAILLADLDQAVKDANVAFIKNLVLALGELKAVKAEAKILEILRDPRFRGAHVHVACLVTLGKISRDAKPLEALESNFSSDLLENQTFQTAVSQIRFRSQWSLEDYLQKFFAAGQAHPQLPLEFNGFPEKDVHEGLKLFADSPKLLNALSLVSHDGVTSWYDEFYKFAGITDPLMLLEVLQSLSKHHTKNALKLLKAVEKNALAADSDDGVFWAFFETLSLSSVDFDADFKVYFESAVWPQYSDRRKNAVITHYMNAATTAGSKAREKVSKTLLKVLAAEKNLPVKARLVRAFAQLGIHDDKLADVLVEVASDADTGGSFHYYCERVSDRKVAALLLQRVEKEKNLPSLFRSLSMQKEIAKNKTLDELLKNTLVKSQNDEEVSEALRCLAAHPNADFHDLIAGMMKKEQHALNAVIALKAIAKESSADALSTALQSKRASVSGRALDALCAIPGVRAKRIVIDYLKEHSTDIDVCDKIIRSLLPPDTGNDYFIGVIDGILKNMPEHARKDGLIDLREKIRANVKSESPGSAPKEKNAIDLAQVDAALVKEFAGYPQLDESVKSALRSAEQPFMRPEFYQGSVDKASSVLEYCKAIDLFLEKHYGRKLLFPKLEVSLHEFQNVIHSCGLNEDYPSGERVLKVLGLSGQFSAQSLPVHKMGMIAKSILSGRIVNDRFKTLDGLRAWAVMLLLFSRKTAEPQLKALLPLKAVDDAKIATISKRLMDLQDIRNPAAHRQTFLEFVGVGEVRSEVFKLLKDLETTI